MSENNPYANIGTLSPEQFQQQQELTRQQRMADMLMQNSQQPQGQIIGNRFVAPSWAAQLAPVVSQLAGAYIGKNADEKALEYAKQLRTNESTAMADYMSQLQGKPAAPASSVQPTIAGKPMRDDETGALYPPIVTQGKLAIEANPIIANMNAMQNPYSPAWLKQHAIKEITKSPKWNEVSKYNEKTGNTDTFVYDQNSSNPESTMRFVSTSKPALTLDQRLSLADRGIAIPNNVGGSVPTGNAPVMGGQQSTQNNPIVKPVLATNQPKSDLIATYGYDPFKPPPTPAMPSPQAAREWQAGLSKPLDGTPANTVTGATTYMDALDKYNDYIKGLSTTSLTNPQVRTKLNSLYAQVKLTGKEANNLGVLNGGDEHILEEVVPNYSNILVTKKTVQKILDEQKEFGSSKIVSTYRTSQKPVPENMRKYVVVPKVEEIPTKTPKQTGSTAKAILNGEQIEVRNGKWVNSKTGQEVK
jgi:hypothetical protein